MQALNYKKITSLPSAEIKYKPMFRLPPNLQQRCIMFSPFPIESPLHGSRQLVSDPAYPNASPFGWHDTNGQAGPEFTITRGNNVNAYLDRNGDNAVDGERADGGATLNFDFPFDSKKEPATYTKAAVTNLFYANNMMHDILYQFGFDEKAGNFQQNNYNKGGTGADQVLAEAQDGSGTNNANFATPPDGSSGRMQMFLWTCCTW
jgi:extracellular elastinolytic metalloproteinase